LIGLEYNEGRLEPHKKPWHLGRLTGADSYTPTPRTGRTPHAADTHLLPYQVSASRDFCCCCCSCWCLSRGHWDDAMYLHVLSLKEIRSRQMPAGKHTGRQMDAVG